MSLLGELDGERERLRLPRLGKHRPAFVARQARQRRERQGFRVNDQAGSR